MAETKRRALISVSDKAGVAEFAGALVERGFEIVSSGGTHAKLSQAGLAPIKVSEITGFPEILDGRVKTLHPAVHGALLARYELESHRLQLEEHGIAPIDAVVVNLYPFAETIAREGVTVAEAVEQIDIGGPAMIRAAAKNFQNLTVLTDPSDYARYLEALDEDGPSLAFRLAMARKAFQHTFAYDMKIADYLDRTAATDNGLAALERDELPPVYRLSARRGDALRYGENPHQRAAFYRIEGDEAPEYLTQHQGKTLSYNNLVDMESAWRCVSDFDGPAAVIVKHTNPCGAAVGEDMTAAFRRARLVDPISSFGGVIAFNREVDEDAAAAVNEQFAELVIAPSFSAAALKKFRRKKNLRVLEIHAPDNGSGGLEVKRLEHGLLVQDRDRKRVPFSAWRLVSKRRPDESQIRALNMAWTLAPHVKSNAIVYADSDGAIGVGAGQMSRVDSAKIAIWKAEEAGLSVKGTAMASDAFFPFRDSVDAAAAAGVTAIVEPGGSIRDEEVIQAADEHGLVLFFTETRHFKH